MATDPSLAPDGGAVTWEEYDSRGSTPKTDIYVSPVGNIATSCNSLNRQLLIAGGSEPFWGPAAVSSK